MPPVHIPLFPNNFESKIFIRRPRLENNETEFVILGLISTTSNSASTVSELVGGGLGDIGQIWVEDVELVAHHHLGRRVVLVVVLAVVSGPIVASLHTVKVEWLAWRIFVHPIVVSSQGYCLGEVLLIGTVRTLPFKLRYLFRDLRVFRMIHYLRSHLGSSQRMLCVFARRH